MHNQIITKYGTQGQDTGIQKYTCEKINFLSK